MEVLMILGGFCQGKTKPNKANCTRSAFYVLCSAYGDEIYEGVVSVMNWEETTPKLRVTAGETNRIDVNVCSKLEFSAKTWYFVEN